MTMYTVEFFDENEHQRTREADEPTPQKAAQQAIDHELEYGSFSKRDLRRMQFRVSETGNRSGDYEVFSYDEVK